ncbi:MAG: hypothetical protein ACQEQO_06660 [Thermodesulfobacteriota bacterium]
MLKSEFRHNMSMRTRSSAILPFYETGCSEISSIPTLYRGVILDRLGSFFLGGLIQDFIELHILLKS